MTEHKIVYVGDPKPIMSIINRFHELGIGVHVVDTPKEMNIVLNPNRIGKTKLNKTIHPVNELLDLDDLIILKRITSYDGSSRKGSIKKGNKPKFLVPKKLPLKGR